MLDYEKWHQWKRGWEFDYQYIEWAWREDICSDGKAHRSEWRIEEEKMKTTFSKALKDSREVKTNKMENPKYSFSN
ncbi:MAG: hypothetical protein H7Y04_16025 [Verrucomicrobia bacterium]|nr:hypothetical protein [Cytophagales bacterium]